MDLNTAIKHIVKGYVDNLSVSDFAYATYTGSGIKIENKPKVIDMSFVIVPQHLTDYKLTAVINGTEQEITIKNKLKVGDKLIVGKATGNQKYFILDRA